MRQWRSRRRGSTRASRRPRATRATCRRTCSCRSACGTKRWRQTRRPCDVNRLGEAKGLSAAQYDFHALWWLQYRVSAAGKVRQGRDAMTKFSRPWHARPGLAAPAGRVAPSQWASHVESEIGRGFGDLSLKSERASMRARLVVESGRLATMKGQPVRQLDELFALGLASVKLGDRTRRRGAEQLQGARSAAPDADTSGSPKSCPAKSTASTRSCAAKGEGLAALESAAGIESEAPNPIARPYPIKPAASCTARRCWRTATRPARFGQFQASLKRTPRRAASLHRPGAGGGRSRQPALASRTAREFLGDVEERGQWTP